MELDDPLCYCFHVPLRKVVNYFRVERPKVASQITTFCSAGGGCGWCVPLIEHIHRQVMEGHEVVTIELSPQEAKIMRAVYHKETGNRPPEGSGSEMMNDE